MFLHVSVILYTGGVLWRTPPGPGRPPRDQADPPRPRRDPPDQGETPRDQADPPPGPRRIPPDQADTPQTRHPPRDQGEPPPGRRLQYTVNERPVRILLECILVQQTFKNVDIASLKLTIRLLRIRSNGVVSFS